MKPRSFHFAFFLAALACAAPAKAAGEDKAALVQRVLALWHIENSAIAMAQRPAVAALDQSRIALQGRVSGPKQEAALKDIAVDVQKYIDEATPIIKANAERVKAPTLTPLLMQNFSAEELQQLVALLESPIKKKFETLAPQFEKAFGEKVAAESKAAIDPKLDALTKTVGKKLRMAVTAP